MSDVRQIYTDSKDEEIMRSFRLLPEDQIQYIIKQRKMYESKINSMRKEWQDYKQYIQFERMVIKKLKKAKNAKESQIESIILHRIKILYELAMSRHFTDFDMHVAYFKFCKQNPDHAKRAIEQMVKHFPDKTEMWLLVSAWFAYDCSDSKSALIYLHKGIQKHPCCEELHTEAIKLILGDMPTDASENSDRALAWQQAALKDIDGYVFTMLVSIKNFHFYIEVLKMLEPHSFTKTVQDKIVTQLKSDYTSEELVWDVLGRREINGYHYNLMENEEPKKSTKYCFGRCVKTYEEGLSRVPPAKRPDLWTLYLDCLIEVHRTSKAALNIISTKLKEAFTTAAKEMPLNEKCYMAWVETAKMNSSVSAEEILKEATDVLPSSVALWQQRLNSAVAHCSFNDINAIFKLGVESLKTKALPLWFIIIRYHVQASPFETIKQIYEDAILQPEEISNRIKPLYIEWLACTKGTVAARAAYNEIANTKPFCKKLHEVMARLESNLITHNHNDILALEKVHVLACNQFKEDIDVYTNYIRFVIRYLKTDITTKLQMIHNNAKESLPPLSFLNFDEKYTVFRSSVPND